MTGLPDRTRGRQGQFSHLVRNGLVAIGPDRKRLVLASGIAFLTGILETVLLFLVASIAVAMTSGEMVVDIRSIGPVPELSLSIGAASLVAGGVVVVLLAISVPLARLLASLSSRASVRLRNQILQLYLGASLAYRSTHREGYLQQLVGEYCMRAENAVQQLATFIVCVCTLSMVMIGAVIASPVASLGAMVTLGLTMVLLAPFTKRARRDASQTASVSREVVTRVAQTTRLADEITAFDVGDEVADALSHDIHRAADSLRRMRYEARLVPTLYQYGAFGAVLLLIGLLSVLQPGGMSGVAPLILLMIRALTYVRQLIMSSRAGGELAPYIEMLEAEMENLAAHQAQRGGKVPKRFEGLDLEHVGFEYKAGQPVLRDVSLKIAPGEVLGLVGPSGNGKSTLSQIILRLRAPTGGTIATGGTDLADVSPSAWSEISAFVPQESKLIFATVGENIRFFREEFDSHQIEAAARAAHLHDEIVALPDGYDTLIGPGARDLSGGQRQRMAIARAVIGSPQLLVLDEPTSALDARSEQLIGQTLDELKGKTTIVLVAHRPATLGVCDRIFRVSQGTLTEIQPVQVQAS